MPLKKGYKKFTSAFLGALAFCFYIPFFLFKVTLINLKY